MLYICASFWLLGHESRDISQAERKTIVATGKPLSEALIYASTKPKYDNRLFIELQVQYMRILSSNLGRTCCVQKFF